MTPEETKILLKCSAKADGMMVKALGYRDEDSAQDAREAMIIAVGTFKPEHGATLESWLMMRGKWDAIDALRARTHWRTKNRQIPTSLEAIVDPSVLQYVEHAFTRTEDGIDALLLVASLNIPKALRELSYRDRSIVEERILDNIALKEIGLHFHLTESRVSQIMTKFAIRLDRIKAQTNRDDKVYKRR